MKLLQKFGNTFFADTVYIVNVASAIWQYWNMYESLWLGYVQVHWTENQQRMTEVTSSYSSSIAYHYHCIITDISSSSSSEYVMLVGHVYGPSKLFALRLVVNLLDRHRPFLTPTQQPAAMQSAMSYAPHLLIAVNCKPVARFSKLRRDFHKIFPKFVLIFHKSIVSQRDTTS